MGHVWSGGGLWGVYTVWYGGHKVCMCLCGDMVCMCLCMCVWDVYGVWGDCVCGCMRWCVCVGGVWCVRVCVCVGHRSRSQGPRLLDGSSHS